MGMLAFSIFFLFFKMMSTRDEKLDLSILDSNAEALLLGFHRTKLDI